MLYESLKVIVKRVIDGDTFETLQGTFVRIRDFNAPERNQLGGVEAMRRLRRLIERNEVTIHPVATYRPGRVVARVDLDLSNVPDTFDEGWDLAELLEPGN